MEIFNSLSQILSETFFSQRYLIFQKIWNLERKHFQRYHRLALLVARGLENLIYFLYFDLIALDKFYI